MFLGLRPVYCISYAVVHIFRSNFAICVLSIGRSDYLPFSFSFSSILANFNVVDVARVRPLRERRRACLFARGGGSSVSLPRAVGISISYSTAVDEACYFPCVRRLVPLPSDPSVYTLPPSSRSHIRAIFVDLSDEVSYQPPFAFVCGHRHNYRLNVKYHFRSED